MTEVSIKVAERVTNYASRPNIDNLCTLGHDCSQEDDPMHISLTPRLEEFVKAKVASGFYNNSSEVIREALRFMETHEEWMYQMKLDRLWQLLAAGDRASSGISIPHGFP